jgi:hypothetical protein
MRRKSQMAWVMARIWASVNDPRSDGPAGTEADPLFGIIEIRPAFDIFAFEPG